jgi:hypothetical protein
MFLAVRKTFNNIRNEMNLKTITKLAAVMAVAAFMSTAHALSITPSSGVLNTTRWQGNQTGTTDILAAIGPITGNAPELYKSDVTGANSGNGSDSGSFSGSYNTKFSNSASDPSDALISYVAGQPVITSNPAYLLVKDGNQTPAWYLFNLSALGWNGTDALSLTGFWPDQGAISHVAIYGKTGTTRVPDGGATVALLGVGLLGLGAIRRKLS